MDYPFLELRNFRAAELTFWGHVGIGPGSKLSNQSALFRMSGDENRATVTSFKEAFERAEVKAASLLRPSMALDTVLFQKWRKLIKLSCLTCHWQEGEDQEMNCLDFQVIRRIADQLDGAIGEISLVSGFWRVPTSRHVVGGFILDWTPRSAREPGA